MAGPNNTTQDKSREDASDAKKAPAVADHVSSATKLSEQASAPGDREALAAAKNPATPAKTGTDAAAGSSATAPAASEAKLSEQALQKKAEELHEAINKKALGGFGWSEPDTEKTLNTLSTMNKAEREKVEAIYETRYHQTLRSELKELGPEGQLRAEAVLNRRDGQTNDAGNLRVNLDKLHKAAEGAKLSELPLFMPVGPDMALGGSMAQAMQQGKFAQEKQNAEKAIRETFLGLNSEGIKKLDEDYLRVYGKTFTRALKEQEGDFSPETKEALKIITQGIDKRTPENSVALAKLAMQAHDPDMFSEALRGDSVTAKQARQLFAKTPESSQLDKAFSDEGLKRAKDMAEVGRVSIASVVDQDNAHWYSKNKEHVTDMMAKAPPEERDLYRAGRELVLAGKEPTTPEERNQKSLYERLNKSLHNIGSEAEVEAWEDKLLRKGTVISELRNTHSDGLFGSGIFGGHERKNLMSAVENMDADSFKQLKEDPTFKRDLELALKKFATPEETTDIMKMVQAKADAPDYEASKRLGRRSLDETIKESQGTLFGLPTKMDTKAVLDNMLNMSPQEAQKIKTDQVYQKHIEESLAKAFPPKSMDYALASKLMEQIKTGKEASLGLEDKVNYDVITNAKPLDTMQHLDKWLRSDDTIADRIQNPKTEQDKALARTFEMAVSHADYSYKLPAESAEQLYKIHSREYLEKGYVPLINKLAYADDNKSALKLLAGAEVEDRRNLLNPRIEEDKRTMGQIMNRFDEQEKQFARVIMAQGNMKIEDQARAYVIGAGPEFKDLKRSLAALTPEQMTQIKNDYVQKYGTNLDSDLFNAAPKADQTSVKYLMSPSGDGRQSFMDNLEQQLKSRSGFADALLEAGIASGTRLDASREMDRVGATLGDFAAKFEKLPKDKQDEIINAYAKAIEEYKKSKGAATDMVVDSTLMLGTFVAGAMAEAGTFGAATPLVAAAIGGALVKVGGTAAMQGEDFDSSPKAVATNAMKGAALAVAGVLGPREVLRLVGAGEKAAALAVAGISEPATKMAEAGLLKAGYETIANKGLSQLTRDALISGKPLTTEQMEKVAASMLQENLPEAARKAALEELTKQLGTAYGASVEKTAKTLLEKSIAGATQVSREALSNGTIGVGAEVTTQTAALPLDWDSRKSFAENISDYEKRLQQGATAGATGAFVFTAGLHVAAPAASQAAAFAKGGVRALTDATTAGAEAIQNVSLKMITDGKTRMIMGDYSNPDVVIRNARGERMTVASGSQYKFNPGDEIVGVADGGRKGTVGNQIDGRVSNDQAVRSQEPAADYTGDNLPTPSNQMKQEKVLVNNEVWKVQSDDEQGNFILRRDLKPSDFNAVNEPITAEALSRNYTEVNVSGREFVADRYGNVSKVIKDNQNNLFIQRVPDLKRVPPHEVQLLPAATIERGEEVKGFGRTWTVQGHTDRGELVLQGEPKPAAKPVTNPEIKITEKQIGSDYQMLSIEGRPYVKDKDGVVYSRQYNNPSDIVIKRDDRFRVSTQDAVASTNKKTGALSEDLSDIPHAAPDDAAQARWRPGDASAKPDIPRSQSASPLQGLPRDQEAFITLQGEKLKVENGTIIIGAKSHALQGGQSDLLSQRIADQHAKLTWDAGKQNWILEDLSQGSYSLSEGIWVHKGGTLEKVKPGEKVELDPNSKLILGSLYGPEVQLHRLTNGAVQADGRVIFDHGALIKHPDGTHEYSTATGKRFEDGRGNVIRAVDKDGTELNYRYNDKDQLTQINFKDGSRARSDDGINWYKESADGSKEKYFKGKIDTEPDGSLRFKKVPDDGNTYIRRLDDSLEKINANGRVEYHNLNFDKVKSRLEDNIAQMGDQARAMRFRESMEVMEGRIKDGRISADEVKQTYHQLSRLLEDKAGTLPLRNKALLAEQVMYQVAHPYTITQGDYKTCNVATVEKRLLVREPSEVARLIADVATTGKYVTASGKVVDMHRMPNGIQPDATAQALLNQKIEPGSHNDMAQANKRTWASQIFESTAANIKAVNDSDATTFYQYEIHSGAKGPEERRMAYSVDSQGKLDKKKDAGDPDLYEWQLTNISNEISGKQEKGFILYHQGERKGWRTDGREADDFPLSSSSDLQVALEKIKAEGNFPAIISVHSSSPLFRSSNDILNSDWHVVNIQGIRTEADGTVRVMVTDQRGRDGNYMGGDAVSLDSLFAATRPSREYNQAKKQAQQNGTWASYNRP